MAYAALLSLTNTIEQILHHHLIPDQNKQHIEPLLHGACSLQDFLENSSHKRSKKIESLEGQIRDAAHEAEDIIESHVADGLLSQSSSSWDENFRNFCQALEKVIEEIHSIKQEAMKIEGERDIQELQPSASFRAASSVPHSASIGKSTMVGLDNDLMEIKTWLLRDSLQLETLSIVGMGGIGKTTIAKNVCDDECVAYHFHTRAWATVSQEYNEKKVLLDLLDSMKKLSNETREARIEQLKEHLYKNLKGITYLIVLDDVWERNVWDDVKQLFPNDKNQSRIMLTTRLENVANYANSCPPIHRMNLLNKDDSWDLFCQKVFGNGCCPLELEEIGKEIVENCHGLPLAVVVIGGLLSNAPKTRHEWINIAENLSSVITSNDDRCSKILSLSYNNLPHTLKGCFLYMGVFPEDYKIRVSLVMKLWAAEGFIKPVRFKCLEDVGEEYLLDLMERSLIFDCERSSRGKIKTCKIHDLLRDMCISEAKKENFFHATGERLEDIPEGIHARRLSIYPKDRIFNEEVLYGAGRPSTSLPRSILSFDLYFPNIAKFFNFSLLRVLHMYRNSVVNTGTDALAKVNLRVLVGTANYRRWPFALLYKFRNLQTLILEQCIFPYKGAQLPPEIWLMTQLRHVQLDRVHLPDPPTEIIKDSVIVLENLQTLRIIENFRCTEEILQRIPNLKKLRIHYEDEAMDWRYYCLSNLVGLHKLESLSCFFVKSSLSFLNNLINFPVSLHKLTLTRGGLPWENITVIGSLPNLQVLKLKYYAFKGPEWEPNEGEFRKLKFLQLEGMNLQYWTADSIHFPSLRHLVIIVCKNLKEIPSGIGEIPTLQSIELHACGDSLVTSAKQIQEEQLEMGNDGLQLVIS